MRFYAVRTDAIELTHQALQKLDQKRKGSRRPSRALRVATLYGHLQCRAQEGQLIQLGCRQLANDWHLHPREIRSDLQDLASIGWLSYTSSPMGLCIRLNEVVRAVGPVDGSSDAAAPEGTQGQPIQEHMAPLNERQGGAETAGDLSSNHQLIAHFAALYNQHKPKSWPAYSPNGNSLAARLQRAIRHAGGQKAFDQVLIQALQAMPEFWRSVYPQGRTGGACVAALLSGDRSTSGLGVEFWHVFSWGAPGSRAMGPGATCSATSGQGSSSVESDPDFRRACRLFVWGDHAWRGQGMEAFELPDQEKQRLTELLEAAGLGSPGQAAKQFATSTNS
jgi:hypothetical protein